MLHKLSLLNRIYIKRWLLWSFHNTSLIMNLIFTLSYLYPYPISTHDPDPKPGPNPLTLTPTPTQTLNLHVVLSQ